MLGWILDLDPVGVIPPSPIVTGTGAGTQVLPSTNDPVIQAAIIVRLNFLIPQNWFPV